MMNTSEFDAVVDFFPKGVKRSIDAMVIFEEAKTSASISYYEQSRVPQQEKFFVRILTGKPIRVRWGDGFRVREPRRKNFLGEGRVLNPHSEKARGKKVKKKTEFLSRLLGDERDMLGALVLKKGTKGLREKEAREFSGLSRAKLLSLSKGLEASGKLRILSFTPLFLVSKQSFDYLCQKILAYLSSYHEKHPGELGASLDRIQKRFDADQRILALVYKRLAKEQKIRLLENAISLIDFEWTLSPQEERVLHQLEEMCYKGEFHSVSIEDLRRTFRLSPVRLNRLLELLIERKKVIQGKDGFLIHSRWLDEIVFQVQNSGKRELTVLDFKNMTGLSRKYAIPLLELLDQMGVTRRKGPRREIL